MAASTKVGSWVFTRAIILIKSGNSRWQTGLRLLSNNSSDIGDGSTDNITDVGESVPAPVSDKPQLAGFARAFLQHSKVQTRDSHEIDAMTSKIEAPPTSFATLLRNSTHVHIGTGIGQVVIGKVFHIVQDDLYIDFGGKFHCVCRRPEKDGDNYQRGSSVRIRLKNLELTDHFIGAARDLTLLEAEADILGLVQS